MSCNDDVACDDAVDVQRIAESALFGLADDGDDPEAIAAANILAATQASRPRGGGDEAATPAAPSTGGAGSTPLRS